jgi:hypothetical protein
MKKYAFEIVDERLVIKNRSSKKVTWEGNPLGQQVYKLVEHPREDLCFLLVFGKGDKRPSNTVYHNGNSNLLSMDFHGEIQWIADLPASTTDGYVNLFWSKKDISQGGIRNDLSIINTLVGSTAQGYTVIINPITGKTIETRFTK